jgi:sugar phosphate isomerase/epimerase
MHAPSLAVQSYCFRGFAENAVVAAKVRELGLSAIEVCAVHVDWGKPETWVAAEAAYREADIRIVSTGVNRVPAEPDVARRPFGFAKLAGSRYMSVDFAPEAVPACLRTAEALAEEHDMKLAIHNHGGRHWLGSAQALSWLLGQCSPRIGLCLDTAWAIDSRENPVELVRRFADRLYGLHIKDFVFDRARKPADVVVGTGNLDLPALAAALGEVGFAGYTVLEYEGDVNDPVPALKECVTAIRQVFPNL